MLDHTRELLARQHVMFAFRSLKFLPSPYQAEDSNRMSLAYFCLSALAILPSSAVASIDPNLPAVDVMLKAEQRIGFIDWVYQQQSQDGGFRGSDSLVVEAASHTASMSSADHRKATSSSAKDVALDAHSAASASRPDFQANLIQSYTALLVLGILSDDFKRLNRTALLRFVGQCQSQDGAFLQFRGCEEPGDPRSTYSAFAIASILDDWSSVDIPRALHFLRTCQRPEGGFGARPFAEPQGGFTYCAIACFHLANKLSELPNSSLHLRWLVDRQIRPPIPHIDDSSDDEDDMLETASNAAGPLGRDDVAGFQGRSGKDTDACYSFWCTAALKLLHGSLDLVQPNLNTRWLLSCQHPTYGGIAREPGAAPDVYHTYLSLAALALSDDVSPLSSAPDESSRLRRLDPAWNVSVEVVERMRKALHRRS